MKRLSRYVRIIGVPVFILALAVLSLSGCTRSAYANSDAAAVTPSAVETTRAEALKEVVTVEKIPIEVVSISDAHPGDDITVTIKTKPGAEVKILFTSPSGSKSAYPKDNTKVAGEDGIITWMWNINGHVPSGEASLTFTPTGGTEDSVLLVKKSI